MVPHSYLSHLANRSHKFTKNTPSLLVKLRQAKDREGPMSIFSQSVSYKSVNVNKTISYTLWPVCSTEAFHYVIIN